MNSVTPLTAEYNYGKTSVNLDAVTRQALVSRRDERGFYHEVMMDLDDALEIARLIVEFVEARDEDTVFEYLEDLEDQRLGVPHPAAHYA